MANRAKKTITITTTEQGFIRKMNALKNIIANLNKKGVKIKIIAPINEKIAKKAKILNLKNVELKDINPKSRFVSVDNKEFLFMTNDDSVHPEYDNAVWVNSEFFAKSLGELFIKNM
jgi:phosphatidylserine/phosphatidylglycerophosphate/cardiolipin synthase-like enzyme